MKLTFIGTGEAFDTERANTSFLIEHEGESTLVDCGYTTPYSLRRLLAEQGRSLLDVPDKVLFTHFHGDHFAGLPALLVPMWDDVKKSGRKKELTIASALPDIKQEVIKRLNLEYPGLADRFRGDGLEIGFRTLNPQVNDIGGLRIQSAPTKHSIENYAYRFNDGRRSFAISGDGGLSEASRRLYEGVDLLVHEAYKIYERSGAHASLIEVVNYALAAEIPRVAIVHMNQEERTKKSEIEEKIVVMAAKRRVNVFFPSDHDVVEI